MIKVAICDDDKQICSKLIAIVKEYFADIGRPVCIVVQLSRQKSKLFIMN